LTHSGRLTHEVVTRQPWIRRRSGKVRQLQTDVLTTEPRRQLVVLHRSRDRPIIRMRSEHYSINVGINAIFRIYHGIIFLVAPRQ